MNVLVTGANGFIGSNLCEWLDGVNLLTFGRENTDQELRELLKVADFVYHLAGVMRPEKEEEFQTVNVGLTARICEHLLSLGRATPIVFTSSIQAMRDNPYGRSKCQAENVLDDYVRQGGGRVRMYRLTNIFGKWAKPDYTSVVATFCHNIARGLEIEVSDPGRSLDLIYIDDVVWNFVAEMGASETGGWYHRSVAPVHQVTLGHLAGLLYSFREMRHNLRLPDLGGEFVRKLYGTYLSYLDPDDFGYALDKKCDARGCLAEFIKSASSGQVFVSRTMPGAVRGNHYHHTKAEKFLVLEGHAVVKFRHMLTSETKEYEVCGEDVRVIDIPPGFAHSIENLGSRELITLFWVSEMFDPRNPDTYSVEA